MKRFWDKVDRSGGAESCWIWLGSGPKGYGQIRVEGKLVYVHRFSWQLANGSSPGDLDVCHSCDNPRCVNPDHLFLGTHQDNMADRDKKGRQATGDRVGSRKYPERAVLHLGEANGNARLTQEQVIAIRAATGTLVHCATEFGVSPSVIWQIRNRRTWRHLP